MVDLQRQQPPTGPFIKGFSGRGFRIGESVYDRGLLLDPEQARDWAAPGAADALTPAMVAPLLDIDPRPEFLLLGTGARMVQPPRAFVAAIEAQGIGVEAMDSRAAARAWGVLRQEGRWIVGALLPLA